MAQVLCDAVARGLRESEVIATITDIRGRKHFICVEKDFLVGDNGHLFLPVGLVYEVPAEKAVLVELPHEAETGAGRIWVSRENFREAEEVAP